MAGGLSPAPHRVLAEAAARHLGAIEPKVTESVGGWRVESMQMGWLAQLVDTGSGPYRLYEFRSDLSPFHRTEALPTIAVLDDGRTLLLNDEKDLSAFLVTALTSEQSDPTTLAALVVHFRGQVGERVIHDRGDLTAAGRRALRQSGVTRLNPSVAVDDEGTAELHIVTAVVEPQIVGGELAFDFRRWTVRALADGTADWQASPLSLGVVDAVRL